MEQPGTRARARVTGYTASLFIVLASFAFLDVVPLLPDPPIGPLLVALGLGALSTRNRGASVAALYLLVFFTVLWQMIGFGFFQLLRSGVGVVVLAVMALPLLAFVNRKVELTSMSIAVLCVAFMFTPAYFVSIPLIAAAAAVTGFASIEALSITFIFFLVPFLLLDNALYHVTSSNPSTPIIFGQLVNLSHNLTPPLPSLNVFLTSLPSSMMSVHAAAVSEYLAHSWDLLIIPLFLMGVAILAASLAGGFTRSMLDRFARLREWEGLKRLASPMAVSLVVPAVFVLLIIPLSASGGFQTSLTNDATLVLMVGTSVVLGGAFVARESLIRRLERAEVGREKLLGLIRDCRSAIDRVRAELEEVAARVPSMGVGPEEMALSEYSSYLADVDRQVVSASSDSLAQWLSHIETSIVPTLDRSEGRLKNGVLNELRNLSGVVMSVNSNLAEAGVALRYTQVPEVPVDDTIDKLTGLYTRVTNSIDAETKSLFEAYSANFDSFNELMDLHESSITLGPMALLDSHEYVTAMRLVSEEYWLGFHLRYSEELEAKKGALLEQLDRLRELLQDEQAGALAKVVRSVAAAKPADSTALLKATEELRSLLASVVSWLGIGPQLVEKMLHSLGPKAAKIVAFQTTMQLNEVLALKKELDGTGAGLDSLTGFIKAALPVLASQAAAWRNDQENLVVLAHYPLARKVIGRMLVEKKGIRTASLPYERRTSEVYARLFASENPGASYDERQGVLESA